MTLTLGQLVAITAVLEIRLGRQHPLTLAVDAEKREAQAREPQLDERSADDDG